MSVSLTEALGGEKPDQPETLQAGTYIAPIWLQSLTYPAASDRLLIDTVWGTGGVVGGAALSVGPRASGGNMSVDIQPGTVVVAGGDVAGQGKYVGRLTAAVNVPLAAPPGAGLTRIDLVYARVYDATAAGGTLNQLTVEEVATGVAAASNPAVPALPATCEALARVTVAAGTAAITAGMVVDVRRQAQMASPTSRAFGYDQASAAGTGAVTVKTFPEIPTPTVPSRLVVKAFGVFGFSATANINVNMDITHAGGSIVLPASAYQTLAIGPSGSRSSASLLAVRNFAAGETPVVVMVGNSAGANCYYSFGFEWELVPGQVSVM